MKLRIARPTQGSIRSMAALPKRGALPQQIMVARAQTNGEIFMGCLLYRKRIFPSITFVRVVAVGGKSPSPHTSRYPPSSESRNKEGGTWESVKAGYALRASGQRILDGGGIETILSRFFGLEKVLIRPDDQVLFGLGIGGITGDADADR